MTADTIPQTTARTRSQQQMSQALAHVMSVRGTDAQPFYGDVCHLLPVLVQTNGLCQALAFIADKASRRDSRGRAFGLIQQHVAAVLEISPPEQLVARVSEAPLTTYLHHTRLVLAAWVYYKRFAVSVLDREPGHGEDLRS